MNVRWSPQLQSVLLATLLALSTGCASLMSSATADLADNLTSAILDQNDPETVRQGAPAYLLLVDGMIADNPHSVELLSAGARLYSSYAAAFVDDPDRARRLARRGRDYGWRALCSSSPAACGSWSAPYPEFERIVSSMDTSQVPVLFVSGVAWATWHLPAFAMSGTIQSAWSFGPYFVGLLAVSVIVTSRSGTSRTSLRSVIITSALAL